MELPAGTRLGDYEILTFLGAGGMGEVYRARDTRLGREVALKLLPRESAEDREQLARFEREARVLASLNHPNVATLYGLGGSGTQRFLVMEFVPGETLSGRLDRGPGALPEALGIFLEIARGLGAAHARGIVHRDLKPANIKVTPEGRVKILDFGLAKAAAADTTAPSDSSHARTLTAVTTKVGVVMGTATYMSPEQARGRVIDQRTDIWAFGCLLYEALCGRPVFGGETVTDVLAAIVRREPDWNALPTSTPPTILRLLRRCLERDAERRLHDIADVRIEIEDAMSAPLEVPAISIPARAARWPVLALVGTAAISAVLGAVLAWALFRPGPSASEPVRRFAIFAPERVPSSPIAVSPDGRHVVFSVERGGERRLYIRPVDSFESRPVAGTEGGFNPFFSPDGAWIGFFTGRELRKVPRAGGAAQTLCEAVGSTMGDWETDGTILFSGGQGEATAAPVLARVPSAGGAPQVLTALDLERAERRHLHPEMLRDGNTVLYTVEVPGGFETVALSLDSGRRTTVIEQGASARYSSTGHLVYYDVASFRILAVPFDARRIEVAGTPAVVVEGVGRTSDGMGAFGFSADGTLVYSTVNPAGRDSLVVFVGRDGSVEPLVDEPGPWFQPRVSPDGRRVVLRKQGIPNCDLWGYDLDRRTLARLTFQGDNHGPVWTPDGRRIGFGFQMEAAHRLYWGAADGSGAAEPLVPARPAAENPQQPRSWSPDGRLLAYTETHRKTGADIWLLPLDTPEPRVFLQTEFQEDHAAFAPSGPWIAYDSNESGRPEVYVRAHAGSPAKIQISSEGGTGPVWSRDGRELFYAAGSRMMKVDVTLEPALRAAAPRELFQGDFAWDRPANYDVTPDGRRFVMVKTAGRTSTVEELRVVLNWFEELRRLEPPG
jgi:serine/threonine-protein kinase